MKFDDLKGDIMKKFILGILLGIVLLVGIVYAAEDIKITFKIPAAKWPTYKKYFLIAYPNQTLNEGEANLTDNQWVKYRIKLFAKNAYRRGKRIEWEEQNKPIYDPNVIE
jgi:hypothetical protein